MSNIQQITCKSALSSTSLPGLDYSLNPYRGCGHDCAYCYAPCILRVPRAEWGTHIQVKENIASILEREITRKKPGIVGLSTVTDPYQPIEQAQKTTRQCLEAFLDTEYPVHIQTKSALVVRDCDLISKLRDAQVMMTISTLHDDERRLLEPGASSIPDRITALKSLTDSGIATTVFIGPLYPTTSRDDLTRLFEAFRTLDITEVWVDKLNSKPGIESELASRLTSLPEVHAAFQKALLPQATYFAPLRQHILACGKEQGITVVDAF
jgi:DNA repair photolyase